MLPAGEAKPSSRSEATKGSASPRFGRFRRKAADFEEMWPISMKLGRFRPILIDFQGKLGQNWSILVVFGSISKKFSIFFSGPFSIFEFVFRADFDFQHHFWIFVFRPEF